MPEKNVTPGRFNGPLKTSYIWWGLGILLVLIALMSGFYTVDQKEQAVVLRLGRYLKTEPSGLHSRIPFGIDKVYKVPTEVVQTVEFGFRTESPGVNTRYSSGDFFSESTMLTGDLNIVDVTWIIQYRIMDPRAYLFNIDNSRIYNQETGEVFDNRIKTIRDISQSTINQLVGDRAYFDVIGAERASIEILAADMIEEMLNTYKMGVDIITVKLQNIVPPEGEVQEAFEDVNKAFQDMERMINEGKESYNKEIPKAQGIAKQMIEDAEGYKIERINMADGDVARFKAIYEEYRKSKTVTRDRLYYEMMESLLSNTEQTELIDKNLDNFLPLKNLDQKGGQK